MKNIYLLGIILSIILTAIGVIIKVKHFFSSTIGNVFLIIGMILFWYSIYKLLFKRI